MLNGERALSSVVLPMHSRELTGSSLTTQSMCASVKQNRETGRRNPFERPHRHRVR